MLEDEGNFTLRGVAERLDVAHRAVAARFGDRAGLAAAVAARGFDRLGQAIGASRDAESFLRAYASFALAHPALYDLMMRQEYEAFARDPALRAAADRIISLALQSFARGIANPTEARRAVMRWWMLVHGGIALHRAGVLFGREDSGFIDELLAIGGFGAASAVPGQPIWNETAGASDDQ